MPVESMAYRKRIRKQRAAKRKQRASEYDTDKDLFPIHFRSEDSRNWFLVRVAQDVITVIVDLLTRWR